MEILYLLEKFVFITNIKKYLAFTLEINKDNFVHQLVEEGILIIKFIRILRIIQKKIRSNCLDIIQLKCTQVKIFTVYIIKCLMMVLKVLLF
jgi:hypothetical protein